MRSVLVAGALLFVLPVTSTAQKFPDANGEVLKGVTVFDAIFDVSVFLDVTANREVFIETGNNTFILALRRDGVRVEESAPNYLFCTVLAAKVLEVGYVAVWDLDYFAYSPDGIHALLWEKSGIMTFGPDGFQPERIGQKCADEFATEWLRWNPR